MGWLRLQHSYIFVCTFGEPATGVWGGREGGCQVRWGEVRSVQFTIPPPPPPASSWLVGLQAFVVWDIRNSWVSPTSPRSNICNRPAVMPLMIQPFRWSLSTKVMSQPSLKSEWANPAFPISCKIPLDVVGRAQVATPLHTTLKSASGVTNTEAPDIPRLSTHFPTSVHFFSLSLFTLTLYYIYIKVQSRLVLGSLICCKVANISVASRMWQPKCMWYYGVPQCWHGCMTIENLVALVTWSWDNTKGDIIMIGFLISYMRHT